jgi:hypothetical protein
MAGSLTNRGEELALNMLFRNTETKPVSVYLGLATSPISESDGMADIVEEDDAGYSRQEVVFSAPAVSGEAMVVENSAQLQFGPWAVDSDNAITHAFLCTEQSGTSGDLLAYFEMASSKSPTTGEALLIVVGDCTFSLN